MSDININHNSTVNWSFNPTSEEFKEAEVDFYELESWEKAVVVFASFLGAVAIPLFGGFAVFCLTVHALKPSDSSDQTPTDRIHGVGNSILNKQDISTASDDKTTTEQGKIADPAHQKAQEEPKTLEPLSNHEIQEGQKKAESTPDAPSTNQTPSTKFSFGRLLEKIGISKPREKEDTVATPLRLWLNKQGIDLPIIEIKPPKEEMEALFAQLNSPIFQSNDNFFAILIQDKTTKAKRIATIEKTEQGWKFHRLKSSRSSESHIGSGVTSEYVSSIEINTNISTFKELLKGKSKHDELAIHPLLKPQGELLLGGPCLTEMDSDHKIENEEMRKIIETLGGKEAVKKIPKVQKRPLSKDRMAIFEKLKSPIFQSNGNFIAILIQDRTNEQKIITVKKQEGSWIGRKFPVGRTSWGSSVLGKASGTTRIEWLLEDGSVTTRTFNRNDLRWPSFCETHLEFLAEVIEGGVNKYTLASF